ncbi:MAG: DUF4180 domain-containing protein [Gallicola sp.]|nr:DUF4180 domain-containing protein [Gallicola sp.]
MKYRVINLEDGDIAVQLEDKSIILADENSALDFLMTIAYETGSNKVIINKENLTEDFFRLKTKVAGNILQKVVNYKMKLAIVGDYSKYSSESLKDFIYECNNGNDIFFVEDESQALILISSSKR